MSGISSIRYMRTTRREDGLVLAVVLVLLLVLSIIALVASQSTALQERMAGNQRDRDIAFQSAEYTLRLVQANLLSAQWTNFLQDSGGLYTYDPNNTLFTTPLYQQSIWGTGSVLTVGAAGTGPTLPGVGQQPEFLVEKMPAVAAPGGSLSQMQYSNGVPPVQVYQIYALGYGGDSNAQVMLQATIR